MSRAKTLETADLMGITQKSMMGPVNYRPLKLLGCPGLIVETPKHRTSIARVRVAIPAQLRIVEKLLEPKSMVIPETTGYMGPNLAEDPRYRTSCGISQLVKTVAVYDRAGPGAARGRRRGDVVERTSSKLFWPETLVFICCLQRN